MYKICKEYNIKPIIRPRKDATIYEKVNYLSERNENISITRLSESYKDGIANWKEKMKYGATLKAFSLDLFEFSLKNKSEVNHEKELSIKCYLINEFIKIDAAKFKIVI